MSKLLEELGVKVSALVAGMSGGFAVAFVLREELSFVGGVATVGTGAISAGYLTPLAVEYVSVSQSTENSLAFLIGIAGMWVIGGIIKLAKRFEKKPQDFIKGLDDE